ncbi:peptidoglycan DD-metalloendopeptidase family protein [Fulvivirga sp. 29W222]|uniref:Peptidoglycan DD-metalloendopeptidase family protein n=1 Tax=Fulvivirga marina TaxID=2494733 RepID=A0A937FZR6_9BACT|nr:M23 family metallopeptidase [Fulvivirga marina]MBL6449039.1 peptidoglycan DD-metalloendopeptidase family protein [Fulvivirga marina]
MAKIRYYYNTETCKYEPIKASKRAVFMNIMGFLSVSIVLALGLIYLYRTNFTPIKESKLLAKNQDLQVEWNLLNDQLQRAYDHAEELEFKDDKIYRVILDTEPIPLTVREGGVGGHDKYEGLMEEDLEQSEMIVGTFQKMDKLKKKLYIQSKSYDQISSLLSEKEKMWASRPAIQPINNKELTRLHTTFGKRYHPILKQWKNHEGLDFTAPSGTPVYATGDGVVTSSYRSSTYGNVIFINHGYGYQTRYAHLTEYIVNQGEGVKRGQVIGYVGSTGRSQAPHLHYEVLFNYKPINPINFFQRDLSNDEYEKLIEISKQETIPLD